MALFNRTLLAVSFTCLSSTLYASTHLPIPNDLTYGGKPIDSLCFFNNIKNNKIDLKHCGVNQEHYKVKSTNPIFSKAGFIGYDWENPSMPAGTQGYSYYQFSEARDHQYWIYSINSGGGSGEFTDLYLVKRIDLQTLRVNNIAGGDRCNGGIQDVKFKNNTLTFSLNLTPYDFVTLANTKIKNLAAYDDIAACAACCAAKAFYTIESPAEKLEFKYADFGNNTNIDEMPDQGKYQICFNKLLVSYTSKEGHFLNQDKVNAFVDQFKSTCIPQKND